MVSPVVCLLAYFSAPSYFACSKFPGTLMAL
jgi:hypothetical protein